MNDSKSIDNKPNIKRDKKGKLVKGTAPLNPAGAPKRGASMKDAYAWAWDLTADEMAALLAAGGNNELAQMFKRMPKSIINKALIAARVTAAIMFEPQAALLNHVVDRLEGPVETKEQRTDDITIRIVRASSGSQDQ